MIIEDLGSFKRVAPLCLRFCRGAPFFNAAHRCRSVWSIQSVTSVWLNETNQMNQTDQIDRIDQTDLAYPGVQAVKVLLCEMVVPQPANA
jgi:hypothetical protein